VLTLDTGDAPEVVERADDLLAPGGYLAVYSPFVEGTREAALAAREAGFEGVETLETIQREMDFSDRGSRPRPRASATPGTWCSAGRRSRQRRNVLSDSAATERMAPPTAGEDTSNPDSDDLRSRRRAR